MILKAQNSGLNGLCIINDHWTDYKVEVKAARLSGTEGFYVGVGLKDITQDKKDVLEYAVAYDGALTGIKVYKEGIQGYTLGDYSSSTSAGNLRGCCYDEIKNNTEYTIVVNYAGRNDKNICCYYTDGEKTSKVLDYKLEAYNDEIFNSVTKDSKQVSIKLVNANQDEKKTKINLKALDVEETGKIITLIGASELVDLPNVNKKNYELIKPYEMTISLDNNSTTVILPANSVNILVFKIK